MNTYLVEYAHDETDPLNMQFFRCKADSEEHAKEQALDVYPGAAIASVVKED